MTIVEELRRNLKHKGLSPPYILVGHSLGGLYMQLFARRYPQEVSGIVLVDEETASIVRGLYPNAKKIVVDSDHQMQTANPEEMIGVITEMIDLTGARP